MAYSRKYSKSTRSKRTKNQAWYDKRHSARSLAVTALKNIHYIKGLVNSEMYHFDRTETAVAVPSTGSILNLVSIAQADTAVTRTGNSILVRNILRRIRFTRNAAATTTVVRYMCFIDTQQIGDTSPGVTDVLEAADVDSGLSISSSGRFKVLSNNTVMLHANMPMHHKEVYKSIYHHIRYNGPASTDIQKGGIYLLVISDQAVNTPTLDLFSRIGYHDN